MVLQTALSDIRECAFLTEKKSERKTAKSRGFTCVET